MGLTLNSPDYNNMGMPRCMTRLSLVLLATLLAVPIIAQEGHPLKGSWIGVWESNKEPAMTC